MNPFRLSAERLRLWASAFIIVGAIEIVVALRRGLSDWDVFARAGLRVGTSALLHPSRVSDSFMYAPAAAWLYVPLSRLTPFAAFVFNDVVMLCCAIVAGLIAATVFNIARPIAVAMVLAWGPVTGAALTIGQNSPLGLMLAMLAIWGFSNDSAIVSGVGIGLLFYKPTYAVPLVVLLVVRAKARALLIAGVVAVLVYLASVAACGGDWLWPTAWLAQLRIYQGPDFDANSLKAISIPGLLQRVHVPPIAIVAVEVIVVVIVIPLLRRVSYLEAGCAACLIGLAVSPHAWGYDGVMALPMIFLAATRLAEPQRTRIIVAAYFIAILTDRFIVIDPLAPIVIIGLAAWIFARRRVLSEQS